jgi:amino-acid N-acetyltransferase
MDTMVRLAKASDAEAIAALVNYYAERGHMLHRSLESVYESLRDFLVCTGANGLTGCAALSITWRDLAEIRSLAVAPERRRRGIGSRLVAAAIEQAKQLGLGRVFVLTYEPKFFQRFGFRIVDKESLPAKVWRDCIHCAHADDCRETAMLLQLGRPHE